MGTNYKETEAQIFNFQKWINECNPEILKNTFQKKLKKSIKILFCWKFLCEILTDYQ